MPSRAKLALYGAVTSIVLLIATWFAAFHLTVFRRADHSILIGFMGLDGPRLNAVTEFVAHLCNPVPYVYLAAVPISVALIRRRPGLAAMIALIMLGANETTQLLKPLLSSPRVIIEPTTVVTGALPSGHATAAMTLALCAVIAVPARARPLVGATMAAFTIAVSYSILELGWHYPSDVFGGFLVATIWTLFGMAALWTVQARRRRSASIPAAGGPRTSVTAALAPVGMVVIGALLVVALIVLARPHALVYAVEHGAFTIGAAAIGAFALTLSTGATLALRRS
jgi:membrane-associated phospholipid phosphatase